jgi:RNA polymerase-binding transcription factor DksA
MEDEVEGAVEGDASTFGRPPDLSVLAQVEGELADVERALQRLDEWTYGNCSVCGTPVSDAELQAAPASAFCAEHG